MLAPSAVGSFIFNLEVYGTKGTFRNNKLVLDTYPDFWDPGNKESEVTYPNWMPNNTVGITEPWDIEIHRFVDWILSGKDETGLCQAIDGIKVAEACWAAVISSKENRVVKLPLINYDDLI
jgi:predicted dehydrogenase